MLAASAGFTICHHVVFLPESKEVAVCNPVLSLNMIEAKSFSVTVMLHDSMWDASDWYWLQPISNGYHPETFQQPQEPTRDTE